ncbi:MAG: hypothetical protein WC980_01985 [Candidatus Brocadiia bacterium]
MIAYREFTRAELERIVDDYYLIATGYCPHCRVNAVIVPSSNDRLPRSFGVHCPICLRNGVLVDNKYHKKFRWNKDHKDLITSSYLENKQARCPVDSALLDIKIWPARQRQSPRLEGSCPRCGNKCEERL